MPSEYSINPGTLAGNVASEAVITMEKTAGKSTNSLDKESVKYAAPELQRDIAKAVDPILKHITSTENPFQARTVWSFIIGTVGGLVVPWGARFGFDIDKEAIDSTSNLIVDTIQAGSIVSSVLLAIWARYAKKPLFSGWFGSKE